MSGNETDRKGFAEVARWLRMQELGRATRIETPFGPRLICYADLTATGRHLDAVEEWVRRVRPYYANTHTEVSSTGRMMTRLREAAREVIRRAVHASADDEVVFVGSGATGAVNKLVGLLGLRTAGSFDPAGRPRPIPAEQRPVVLVGPYEHHSNELPWVESVADVVEIGLDDAGGIDLDELEQRLDEHRGRPLKIGSFAAASNVTGVLSDVAGISRTLRRAGALVFLDYAAAAPYVPIDMHPPDPETRIDAVFLSPHKFAGGPEASGVLVANRELFRSPVPERPGGGTVDYVAGPRRTDVDYVRRLDEREEGGTPAILGDIRAGLAFLVKERFPSGEILRHEVSLAERARRRLSRHPRIRVLGPSGVPRLAIVPLAIEGLHHDLASALLDHLFGIQNRAGCSCAGPYGHRLLGIDQRESARFRELVRRGLNGMKPGWVRLSLPYDATEDDLSFMLSAVEFVADHGLDFVPLYRLDWRDGVWRHIEAPEIDELPVEVSIESLLSVADGSRPGAEPEEITEERLREERASYFRQARALAGDLARRWSESRPAWNVPTGDAEIDRLVWFRYVHTTGGPQER